MLPKLTRRKAQITTRRRRVQAVNVTRQTQGREQDPLRFPTEDTRSGFYASDARVRVGFARELGGGEGVEGGARGGVGR